VYLNSVLFYNSPSPPQFPKDTFEQFGQVEDEDEYYKLSSDYYISVEDYDWIKEELNELEESEDE
jgi:hypothetical protein